MGGIVFGALFSGAIWTEASAQNVPLAAPAPSLIESGVPAFVILGPESLGMTAAPVDLQQMPDGRLLALGHNELAIGDGVRWEVFRQADNDEQVDTLNVAVDETGQIFAGISGGFGRIDFGRDARWRFTPVAKLPPQTSLVTPPMVHMAAAGREWLWWWTTLKPLVARGLLADGHRINDLCAIGQDFFAAAVDNFGLVFFDRTGRTVQVLDRSVDHRLSRVNRLLRTSHGVVWARLTEGIARIGVPNRLSNFEAYVPTGLAFAQPYRHDGRLWLLSDGRAQRGVYDEANRLERFDIDTLRAMRGDSIGSNWGPPESRASMPARPGPPSSCSVRPKASPTAGCRSSSSTARPASTCPRKCDGWMRPRVTSSAIPRSWSTSPPGSCRSIFRPNPTGSCGCTNACGSPATTPRSRSPPHLRSTR